MTVGGIAEKTVEIVTFGCRLNIAESEMMRTHAQGLGNTVIINTCAVTQEAQRQARQAIRRMRRTRPGCKIVVTGCGVHVNRDMFAHMPEVDFLLSNTDKLKPEAWEEGFLEAVNPDAIGDLTRQTLPAVASPPAVSPLSLPPLAPSQNSQNPPLPDFTHTAPQSPLVTGMEGKTRAFLQIQNGCDHRCTFCIIPEGRGKSRSVPVGALVQQLNQLVDSGVGEVVLTGVDLTAYGLDLPGQPTLSHTLKRLLHHVPKLTRLRLSSLDPAEVDEDFFQLMAHDHRLLPHVHLSLQAGDDLILKRMKRRHLRDHVIAFCNNIRAARPDVLIGADVIAGFPTETDAHFQNTLELLQQTDIFLLHVFPFSPHPGTPAARMPQVPRPVVKERAGRLRQWSQARREVFYESQRGQCVGGLLEQPTYGHTDHFLPFTLAPGERAGEVGEQVQVRLMGAVGHKLLAVRV